MTAGVEVDWSHVQRGMRQLADGIDAGSLRTAREQATATAAAIRPRVPVRTGALRSTVTVVDQPDGAGVTYGGDLPYANYIEHRSDAVADGVAATAEQYGRAATEMARREVRKL